MILSCKLLLTVVDQQLTPDPIHLNIPGSERQITVNYRAFCE
jgi:hypothetical protein